jgi:hypothetical protein
MIEYNLRLCQLVESVHVKCIIFLSLYLRMDFVNFEFFPRNPPFECVPL